MVSGAKRYWSEVEPSPGICYQLKQVLLPTRELQNIPPATEAKNYSGQMEVIQLDINPREINNPPASPSAALQPAPVACRSVLYRATHGCLP